MTPAELVLVWPSGSPAAPGASSAGVTLPDALESVLRPCRTVAVLAQVQANPIGAAPALVLAQAAVLAALPRVDWDFLKLVGGAAELVTTPIRTLIGAVGDTAAAPVQYLGGILGDLGNVIYTGLLATAEVVKAGLITTASTAALLIGLAVSTALTTATATVSTALAVATTAVHIGLDTLGLGVQALTGVARLGLASLGTLLSTGLHLAAAVVAAPLALVANALAAGMDTLNAALWGIPAALVAGLCTIQAIVAAQAGELIVQALVWLQQHVLDPMLDVAGQVIAWVGDEVAGIASGDPEAVLPLALGLLTAAIPLGMAAHGLAVAAEHTHPLKHIGYTTIARLLVDMTSLRRISAASIGQAMDIALARPMESWLSRRIRYRIPDIGSTLELLTSRHISDNDARLTLAYNGYNEARIAAVTEGAWRVPSMLVLRRLVDEGTMPPEWLREKIRLGGYHDADVDVIAGSIEHNQFAKQRNELYAAAYGLLAQGVSTPQQFAADVGILHLHPDQVALAAKAATMKHANDLVTYQAATLTKQAQDGVIAPEELGVALSALGMAADRVRAYVARVVAYRSPKIAAKIAAEGEAEYRRVQTAQTQLAIQRFRRGLDDDAGLYTRLVAVGLDRDLATTTVDIELARRTPLVPVLADKSADQILDDVLAQLQKAYLDEFRAGMIDVDALAGDLTALGLDPALVEAIVRDEVARAYRPPDTIPIPPEEEIDRTLLNAVIGLYRDYFRAGMIDETTYLQALIAAGMDADLAEVTVERERLRLSTSGAQHPAA